GALASLALSNEFFALVSAAAVVGILVGVRVFGYGEFQLVKQRLLATVSSLLHGKLKGTPQTTQVHLQGSIQWGELWSRFQAAALELNLKTMWLNVNAPLIHEGYHAQWERPGD